MGQRRLLAGFAALLLACTSPAPPRSPSLGRAGPPVKLDLPAAAGIYDTKPAPGAALGGHDANDVERALVDAAKSKGLELAGDGRLAQLGQFILSAYQARGHLPASASVDACAHHVGLIEPVPYFMVFGKGADGSWASSLEEMLREVPRGASYNRYGIVVSQQTGQPLAACILSAASADIAPIPRSAPEGGAIVLRGKLTERFRDATIEVTRPNGSVDHVGDASGASFDVPLALSGKGVHRVELLAHGPFGAEVLANFPIFVGVPEPSVVIEAATPDSDAKPGGARAVEERLLVLLNDARGAAGVPPLVAHAGLTDVAELHSRDMLDSGFFGHDSPTYGDPATRVHRKGLAFVLIAENIGRGGTAEEVNTMLLESPGHRANALNANLTDVGIGVVLDVRQGHQEIVATEDFGGVARSIDVNAAPAEVLRAINAERAKAGAPPLILDPLLTQSAARGVERFFRDPAPSQQDVVSSVNEELVRPVHGASPIAKRMRAAQSSLFAIVSLEQTPKVQRMLDPSARYVGVGVAQGNRPETGPNTIAVVVVLGWPR